MRLLLLAACSSPTRPAEVSHPIFARVFDRLSALAEAAGQGEHRDEALAGLTGRVIEVGAGNGMNFRHYPETVEEVVAVEPEPYLRDRAREAAARAPVAVRVIEGVADALPAADGEFDAGVASLVLCSVADQDRALGELRRAIRPGGELRFYEHVVSHKAAGARFQRFSDATYWPRVAGGCHCSRDTLAAIERAGFAIERQRRLRFAPSLFVVPATPHVVGVARRA